jgi:prefoldin subunit 5
MRVRNTIAILVLGTLLGGCAGESGEPHGDPSPSFDDVRQKAAETVETASDLVRDRKAEYEQQLERALGRLDERIAELRAKVEDAGDEAASEWKKTHDDLVQKRQNVRKRLDDLKSRGSDAWDDLREGLDASVEELRKSVEDAASRFE